MAELELSILSRQCLNRRFDSAVSMEREMEAWNQKRNQAGFGDNWRFTTADARIKLKTLYPIADDILR